ncbi:MAG: nitroreductase family protein [Desulfobacterales bacterium]|nr:nitroreductase family protein [Desulfobacterales bacterium]
MEFNDVVYGRRAVNFFDPRRDITDGLLRQVLETAAQAPSSSNLQPWSLIVLRDPDAKMRLQKLAWNQPKVSEAPVALIVLADTDGWKPGHFFVEKNFREMVQAGIMDETRRKKFDEVCFSLYGSSQERKIAFACKNAAFFAMGLMLAAKNFGLDTHPMDGFDIDGVRKEFHIPDNYWIPLLISIGYFRSDKELMPSKWRKSYDEMVVRFDQ